MYASCEQENTIFYFRINNRYEINNCTALSVCALLNSVISQRRNDPIDIRVVSTVVGNVIVVIRTWSRTPTEAFQVRWVWVQICPMFRAPLTV